MEVTQSIHWNASETNISGKGTPNFLWLCGRLVISSNLNKVIFPFNDIAKLLVFLAECHCPFSYMILCTPSIPFLSKQLSIQLNWHCQNGKHACTRTRTHTHTCTHTHAHTHTSVHTQTRAHMHTNTCVCVCVCVKSPLLALRILHKIIHSFLV